MADGAVDLDGGPQAQAHALHQLVARRHEQLRAAQPRRRRRRARRAARQPGHQRRHVALPHILNICRGFTCVNIFSN